MGPFKPSLVMGINDACVDAGLYRWPSEKVGFEASMKIATEMGGDEVLPQAGMTRDSAYRIIGRLKSAADALAKGGYQPTASELLHQKHASAMSLEDRASRVAEAYMAKISAEAGSLTDVGENTPESAAQHDQHAKLDLSNRGPAEYLVGMGNTQMYPAGIVGKEMAHPKGYARSPSVSNSLTEMTKKNASELATLALKAANEDMAAAELGGGGLPPAMEAAAGAPPGVSARALEHAKHMIAAFKHKLHGQPSPEGQLAMAGLAEHPQGMDVMAQLLEQSKTAGEADEILQQILQHQGEAGELASPELVAAIEHLLSQEGAGGMGGGEGAPPQAPPGMPPAAAPPGVPAEGPPEAKAAALVDHLKRYAMKGEELAKGHKGALTHGAAAAGGAAAGAGAMALRGHEEHKEAAMLERLKRAAEGGSLTDVGQNTPEGAAKTESTAELDEKNRAAKQYLKGQGGGSDLPNKGQIYAVQKDPVPSHPNVPSHNTPTDELKSAAMKLSVEEEAYVAEIRKVAEVYGTKLPAGLTEDEKVAHLVALHGKRPAERTEYVKQLFQA